MERIENRVSRHKAFHYRKGGLFDAAGEVAALHGAHVGVILFSTGGNRAYCFGSPSVGHVFPPLALPGGDGAPVLDAAFDPEAMAAAMRQLKEAKARVATEKARVRAIKAKVVQAMAGRRFLWEADVEVLGTAELPEFIRALERHRDQVLAALEGKNDRPSKSRQ